MTLSGNGLAVMLKAPKLVTLPGVAAGMVGKAKSVTIKNKSDVAVTLGDALPSADFTVLSDTCASATLPANGGKCVVKLALSRVAGSLGTLTSMINYPFTYGANSGNVIVTLKGEVKMTRRLL